LKIVHQIDSNNLYVTDVILNEGEEIPSNCVDIPMPEGIFLPAKFENGEWSSTLSQEEINAKMTVVTTPSDLDLVKKTLTDLSYNLMMAGVL
jgi:hypothetical protein